MFLTSGTVRTNVSSYIPVVGSVEPPKPEVMFATYGGDKSVSFVADSKGASAVAASVTSAGDDDQ